MVTLGMLQGKRWPGRRPKAVCLGAGESRAGPGMSALGQCGQNRDLLLCIPS